MRVQSCHPDKRVLWLKKVYLQLHSETERSEAVDEGQQNGPKPVDALQAFGGRVEKWRNLGAASHLISTASLHSNLASSRPTDSLSTDDGGRPKSRLKQISIAFTKRVKGASRNSSRSTSPQPHSTIVRPPSVRSQLSSHSGGQATAVAASQGSYLLKPRAVAMGSSGGAELGGDSYDADSLYTTPRSRTPTVSNL